jgi:hypothetical protein
MILNRALYELCSSEANKTIDNINVLNRQMMLEVDPIRTIYISWVWGRENKAGDRCFSLGYRDHSYFTDSAHKILNVSNEPMWRPFIGNSIELSFIDDDYRILRLRNKEDSIYCHSFQENAITIGTNAP